MFWVILFGFWNVLGIFVVVVFLFLVGVNWVEEGFGIYRAGLELEWLVMPGCYFNEQATYALSGLFLLSARKGPV